jgi:hypothetical protein
MAKKFRLWLAALVMGIGIVGQADATPYIVGPFDGPSVYGNTSPIFANGAVISDTYSFSLTLLNSFVSIAQSIIGPGENFSVSNFMLQLVGPGTNLLFSPTVAHPSQIVTGVLALAPGDYVATVTGTATGPDGGIYGIQMATSVPAVPEPSEWMMMLAGLVLVGFMVKRRSSNLI